MSSLRRSSRRVKKEDNTEDAPVKQEQASPNQAQNKKRTASASTRKPRSKRVKTEQEEGADAHPTPPKSASPPVKDESSPSPSKPKSAKGKSTPKKTSKSKASDLQDKKLKSYAQYSHQSPFPDFPHPTPEECKLAHQILASLHGERVRPEASKPITAPSNRAGCGDSPTVLDAMVRTILSQNTSDKNSSRAKQSMDGVYGGSDKWDAIVQGGRGKLQKAIESGGLSVVKSNVIINILEQVKERYGKYSMDHLFEASDEEAMREMISFKGVGPKTASCVLLFCLRRESFAVDTHVHRITGLLGWRPQSANRDETHAHLDAKIPDEDKYGLHILLVGHGKKCDECKAGGRSSGKCELRKAFRKGKVKGEAGQKIKEEEIEEIKKEEDGEDGQQEYVHGMEQGA